jgi:hypothetical protein
MNLSGGLPTQFGTEFFEILSRLVSNAVLITAA